VDKITVGSIADSKPSMVVSTQAAAALTVGAGELVVAVGTNIKDINNQRAVSGIKFAKDALQEAQYPVGAAQFNVVTGEPPSLHSTYVITNPATIGVLHTEDEVVIAYDQAFYSAGNSSNIGNIIDRAIEVYQEQVLKLN